MALQIVKKEYENFLKNVEAIEQDPAIKSQAMEILRTGDPRKQRVFELETYGKAVGLSDEKIAEGVVNLFCDGYKNKVLEKYLDLFERKT